MEVFRVSHTRVVFKILEKPLAQFQRTFKYHSLYKLFFAHSSSLKNVIVLKFYDLT